MTTPWTLYGQKGTGAVAIEAALALLAIPYEVREPSLRDPDARDAFGEVNPMRQFPALVLPSGELITESAAILIWLAETHPHSGLAPKVDAPERGAFLQWMAFVSSAIYALYWVRDDPSRLADTPRGEALIKTRTADRISACWAVMESRLRPGCYLLGDALTVLDLYVAVVSRWGPRRKGFRAVAPRMAACMRRVDDDARLAALWVDRFRPREGD
jgi:GST-like protein